MLFWMPKVAGRAAAAEDAGTGLNGVKTSGLCSCGPLKLPFRFSSARVSTLSSLSWLVFSEDNCICLFLQFPLPCRLDAVLVSIAWLQALCRCCSGKQVLIFTQTWLNITGECNGHIMWLSSLQNHSEFPENTQLCLCMLSLHFPALIPGISAQGNFLLILYIPKVHKEEKHSFTA